MPRFLRILAMWVLAGTALVLGPGSPRPAIAIEGAVQNPANGHWYKMYPTNYSTSWWTCKANAEALGGYLATLTSAGEAKWVTDTFKPSVSGPLFIGGSDEAAEGTWVWVTGEPWSYSNWMAGEPGGDSGHNFNVLRLELDSTWRSARGDGTAVQNFIVEWDGDPNPPVPPDPPAAPTNLRASVSYGNPIVLTWTDNSTNEEVFEIERCTGGAPFQFLGEICLNSTSFEDVATTPNVAYTYRVRARNSGGPSDYSNEATATASSLAPAPRAPSALRVLSATRDRLEFSWVDNSVDEVGFEVHRRTLGGALELVATAPANSWSYTHEGLVPDSEWIYGVRAVNAFRTSGFCECPAATLPTLQVTALRADLKDSPKFGKDSMKVQALFDFLPASPDGLFDPLSEGITIRAGTDASPVVMTLPGGLDTWKVRRGRATWKSPRGSTPKYMVQVDLEDRLVKASAAGLELAVPAANPMRVSVAIGNDAGTARGDWVTKKPGVFRLR